MTDNSEIQARTRHTARLCTGSFLGNLPNRSENSLQSPFVLNTTQGQVLPQAGLVIGPRIRASSTDQPQTGTKKRVYKPKTTEQREAYNAKRRKTAEQRKYSGISYTKPNPKTKNDGYYTVCHKNCRKRFETKEDARDALKRYQNGECPVCGMQKPKMKGTLPYPDPESDSEATHGTHSSDSESESEVETEPKSVKTKPQTRAQTKSSAPAPAPAPASAAPTAGAINQNLPSGELARQYLLGNGRHARFEIRPVEGTRLIVTINGVDTIMTGPFILP